MHLRIISFLALVCIACSADDQTVSPTVITAEPLSLVRYIDGVAGAYEGVDGFPMWTFAEDSLTILNDPSYSGSLPFGLPSGAYRSSVTPDSVVIYTAPYVAGIPLEFQEDLVLQLTRDDTGYIFTYEDSGTELFQAFFR